MRTDTSHDAPTNTLVLRPRGALWHSVLGTTLLAMTACGSRSDSPSFAADGTALINDEAALAERITPRDEPVPVDDSAADTTSAGLTTTGLLGALSMFSIKLVGELTPPTVNGQKLQANALDMSGSKIYVSYNTAGETQRGGISVIDVTVPAKPVATSELLLANDDINDIAVSSDTVYVVGAKTVGEQSEKPAFLAAVKLTGGALSTSITRQPLASFAGNGIVLRADSIVTTSGDTGGVTVFDRSSLVQTAYVAVADARGVAVAPTSDNVMVVSGRPGVVRSYGKALSGEPKVFNIGGATIAQAKATIESGKTTSIVATGDGGVKLICNDDGTVISSVAAVVKTGIAAASTTTNAAAISSGILFTANGEAGVHVYAVDAGLVSGLLSKTCSGASLRFLGTLTLGTSESVNAVYYKNNYLFAATGNGGLKIMYVTLLDLTGLVNDFL